MYVVFEGNGKAVLYTGDIRSEPWFVNNLTRNPCLVEYTSGLKTLDCIYLDTSNINPISFPTKASGLRELLKKVSKYPPETVFHFEAWTFGYEEVWMALSKALKSPIHVDTYKYRLYQSLRGDAESTTFPANEGPALMGYTCGNRWQDGSLTSNTKVRVHSCEKGMHCFTLNENTVWIRPIITRARGEDVEELGIGGGGGDLVQHPDLVLDAKDKVALMALFSNAEEDVKNDIRRKFFTGLRPTGKAISLDGMGFDRDEDELSLTEMAEKIAQSLIQKSRDSQIVSKDKIRYNGEDLPKTITFPYSRHSSYEELRHLVGIFRPKDVYPCTVDEDLWFKDRIRIDDLFGVECFGSSYRVISFRHDREMCEKYPEFSQPASQHTLLTQRTQASSSQPSQPVISQHVRQGLPAPETPGKNVRELKRDALGRLRLYDADGNMMAPTSETLKPRTTPPRQIIANSPGSESQSLRRKAIHDQLGGDAKRLRLQFDGSSSPQIQGVQLNEHQEVANFESSSASERQNTPGSEIDSNDLELDDVLGLDDVPGDLSNYQPLLKVNPREPVLDTDDTVYRCRKCWSEVWGGICTGCEEGPNEPSYYEVVDEENERRRPNITTTEYTDEVWDELIRAHLLGDTLDDDESAYDSQDSAYGSFREEYEVDSFIDEASSENSDESSSNGEESEGASDEEEDYKAKYENLQKSHALLAAAHIQAVDERIKYEDKYFELRDALGSEFDSDSDEERDEDGLRVVNAVPAPVVTTELILSDDEEANLSDISEITIPAKAATVQNVTMNHGNKMAHIRTLLPDHSNFIISHALHTTNGNVDATIAMLCRQDRSRMFDDTSGLSAGGTIGSARGRHMREVFDAVSNEGSSAWQETSLISTSNNHTFPEIEL